MALRLLASAALSAVLLTTHAYCATASGRCRLLRLWHATLHKINHEILAVELAHHREVGDLHAAVFEGDAHLLPREDASQRRTKTRHLGIDAIDLGLPGAGQPSG